MGRATCFEQGKCSQHNVHRKCLTKSGVSWRVETKGFCILITTTEKKRQTYQFSQTGLARMCSFNPNKAKIVWNLCTCEAQRPTESTITLLSFNLDAHSINATAEFQVTPGMCQLQHMDLSRNRNPGCSLAPQHPIGWNKLEGFCTKIAQQPRE